MSGTMRGVQFLTDYRGKKTAAFLDFEKHGELWEDVYDNLIIESIADEPSIPFEEVERELMERGKLSV